MTSPTTPPDLLACSMGNLLKARRSIEDLAHQFARSCDLRLGELDLVLELLSAPDGIGQRELVRRLRVSHAAVSSTLTNLANRGVVERIPTAGDGRSWRVKLVSRETDRALAVNLKLYSDGLDQKLGRTGLAGLTALLKLKSPY